MVIAEKVERGRGRALPLCPVVFLEASYSPAATQAHESVAELSVEVSRPLCDLAKRGHFQLKRTAAPTHTGL